MSTAERVVSLRDDLLMGADAAAAHLGVKPRTVYHLVKAGSIPFIKKGRTLFFRKSALDAAFVGAPETSLAPYKVEPVASKVEQPNDRCRFRDLIPLFQELFEPEEHRAIALQGRMKNFLRLDACPAMVRDQGKTSGNYILDVLKADS